MGYLVDPRKTAVTPEKERQEVLDFIEDTQERVRTSICPVCGRYGQLLAGRCYCDNRNHGHRDSDRCPVAKCRRVEARRTRS